MSRKITYTEFLNDAKDCIDNYISENDSVKGILSKIPHRDVYMRRKWSIRKIVEDLGYNWFDIAYYGNVEWLKSKDELDKAVIELMAYYNNTLSRDDLIKFGITKIIVRHYYNSFNDMLQNLDLLTDKAYVDLSGYKCGSYYEVQIANYFIENNIKFKREQQVFKLENTRLPCRSDFTVYKNGQPIQVEIWGYYENPPRNKITKQYNIKYNLKMSEYKRLCIPLISLYQTDFTTKKIIT